jgi:ribonucleotide reductase alpha subunit
LKIKSVTKNAELKPTWDIEVKNTHSYQLANGVLSHNTIANILGVPQSHELPWDIEYVKENLSGTFKVIAPTVIHNPHRLPTPLAREADQKWSIWCAAARQVNIDQSQSLNLFYDPNLNFAQLGDLIDENYFEAWACGVKTNYYLYSRASENAKQTLNKPALVEVVDTEEGPACYLRPGDVGFESCESCS